MTSVPLDAALEPSDVVPLWATSAPVEATPARPARPVTREPRPLVDVGMVREALEHLSADDYDTWLQAGMALKLDVESCFAI